MIRRNSFNKKKLKENGYLVKEKQGLTKKLNNKTSEEVIHIIHVII